ncbi:cell wall-binding repeat-containing protein [Diaminobutyricibacter sp. McL0608]|uniref:cell wall-binding repeat-containing protein n=1 Tax=Leifsonia sp. McL0608 TaxID=3143537 RepID=UPI0031F31C6E
MRERTSLPKDGSARPTGRASGPVAVLFVVALALVGLAVSAPASATDSYRADRFHVWNNPRGVAFTPDGSTAVIVNDDPLYKYGTLTKYDAATHVWKWRVDLDGVGANGVAISPDGTQAYATYQSGPFNSGGLTVVDLVNYKKLDTITGTDPLWNVAFTPDGSKVYATEPQLGTPNGSVVVVDPATRTVLTYITVCRAPSDLVFSPDSSRAYVLCTGNGTGTGAISVIDVATSAVTATIPLGISPKGIAITPDGSALFATNFGDGTLSGSVSVVSTATNTVTSTISHVGVGPAAIRISPDGAQAWVLNTNGANVAVIDVATETVVERFPLSVGGMANIAFTPDGERAWVDIDGFTNPYPGMVASFDVKSARWNPTVSRVSGADRYLTSVEVAKTAFPTVAPVVFVATGTGFADALAAAAPAAQLGGPLLLTDPDSLPASVQAEIQSLQPSTIYIVGGTGAISTTVEQQLHSLAPTVTRLAGSDRFETARKVIDVAFPSFTKVYVATGKDFPDALSASAAGGAAGIPVLLVNGTDPSLDQATTAFLTTHGANAFTVLGGPTVVSGGITNQLGDFGRVTRIYGSDRYATSQLINADAFTAGTGAYFATGTQFADALSGAVLAAVNDSPLYVVQPGCVPEGSMHDLASRGVSRATLIGGTGALNNAVAAMYNC